MRSTFRSRTLLPGWVSRDRRAPASIARKETTRLQHSQKSRKLALKYPPGAPVLCWNDVGTTLVRTVAHGSVGSLGRRTGTDTQRILDSVPHVVWTASADGATMSVNPRGAAYMGHAPTRHPRGGWFGAIHPDDQDLAKRAWVKAVTGGADYAVECRFRRFDGVYRWHSFRAEPVRGSDGNVDFWIGTATDVDDQRSLELSLRQSEKEAVEALSFLETIGDAAPVGFKLVDHDLRIVWINKRLADDRWPDCETSRSDAVLPKRFRICGPSSKMSTAGR